MTFEEWYESAREQEPYLSRGISEKDIWEAAYRAGLERAAKIAGSYRMLYTGTIVAAIRAELEAKS